MGKGFVDVRIDFIGDEGWEESHKSKVIGQDEETIALAIHNCLKATESTRLDRVDVAAHLILWLRDDYEAAVSDHGRVPSEKQMVSAARMFDAATVWVEENERITGDFVRGRNNDRVAK